MLRKPTLNFAIICLCSQLLAVVVPGDSLDQAIDELGMPRARISLPDEVYLMAFDRGAIWVRGSRVIGVDLLTTEAFAARQKADAVRREQVLQKELETVSRGRARELAADAEAKRQASLVEQVRREVRFPTYPLAAFGTYFSVNPDDTQGAKVAVDFRRPSDHERNRRGEITAVHLIVTNRQPSDVDRRQIVLTFVSRDGVVKGVAETTVPAMAANEWTTVVVPVAVNTTGGSGIADGRLIYELRADVYDDDMNKVPLTNSRWLRVEPGSPEAGALR